MSDIFDPYYKWLGIPPEEQPAHHYRLFGLRRFEDDPEVIENAASQRMAHVRTFQMGQHSRRSQEMLNELSAAQNCLLNADKKRDYDDLLRRQTQLPAERDLMPPPAPFAAQPPATHNSSPPEPFSQPPATRLPVESQLPITGNGDIPVTPAVPLNAPTSTPALPLTNDISATDQAAAAPVPATPVAPLQTPLASLPPTPLPTSPLPSSPPANSPPEPAWSLPLGDMEYPLANANGAPIHEYEVYEEEDEGSGGWLRTFGSVMLSAVAHLVLFLLLALMVVPELAQRAIPQLLVMEISPPSADELITSDLLEIESDTAVSIARSDPLAGLASSVTVVDIDDALLEASYNEREEMTPLALEGPKFEGTELENILGEIKVGGLGESHAVVDDYQQALDRITQEILMLVKEENLLLVWLFDQSASMKDDQKEIHDRVENIYAELADQDDAGGEALKSVVASFGESFLLNTSEPTSHAIDVQEAIARVPDDPSGKEMMCQAVLQVMATYGEYAKANDRKLAIIVVTDESGEQQDNVMFLEPAIAQAKLTGSRIYVLGREAAFGSPHAQMKWVHPLNGREYWLPVDRGPESAFVEQLQTDGFGKRVDVHPSGFGPYGQCRLAKETGGVFFMLPSQEVNLVRGEARRFELKVLTDYRPDLRSRGEVAKDSAKDRLRVVLSKVINDINPYREEVSEITQVRRTFSAKPKEFFQQVTQEKVKAATYLSYLNRAIKEMEKIESLREEEPSLRWRANYDLAYAQLLAYAARTYEYIATIDEFAKNPRHIPLTKLPQDGRPGHLELRNLKVELSEETIERGLTNRLIEQSSEVFAKIIEEHEGTPWAARAEWELTRGFGVRLTEEYRYVAPPKPKPPKGAGGAGRPRPNRPKPRVKPAAPTIVVPKAL